MHACQQTVDVAAQSVVIDPAICPGSALTLLTGRGAEAILFVASLVVGLVVARRISE